MKEEHLRLRDHEKDKLAFYSKATTDFEYLFPFGWGELWGVADRTDYDLKQHMRAFRQSPWNIWIPSPTRSTFPTAWSRPLGVDRVVLAFLCDAYDEEELEGGDVRTVLHLHPALAPYQGRRAAAAKEQAGRQGATRSTRSCPSISWWITTRPAPSASATAARTRPARPSALARRLRHLGATGNVTVRDRDTMQQDVVPVDGSGQVHRGQVLLLIERSKRNSSMICCSSCCCSLIACDKIETGRTI